MPGGTCPPDPYTDPRRYHVWYHTRLGELLEAGNFEGIRLHHAAHQETASRLELELADTQP